MPSSANVSFVQALYQAILLRSGSTSDVDAWASALDGGSVAPPQAIQDIEISAEAADFVLPVVRMYQGFFGRAPDAAGLQGWVNALRSGAMTLQQVAHGFAGSSEFTSLYGTSSPAVFVTAVYENLLGRAPDAPGLNGWVAAFDAGTLSAADVVFGIEQSEEAIARLTPGEDQWLTAGAASALAGGPPSYPTVVPISTATAPASVLLTTGVDSLHPTGGAAILGTVGGAEPTLQGADTIVGNGSTLLEILSAGGNSAGAVLPAGLTLSGIHEIDLAANDAGQGPAAPFDVSGIAGLGLLNVGTSGPHGDFIAAGTATDVVAAAAGAGGTTITGGHNVTVSAAAGVTLSGAAGAIAVTENGVAGAQIAIDGGTTVAVASAGSGDTITIGGEGVDPTGLVTIVAPGTDELAILPTAAVPASVTLGSGATVTIGSFANAGGTAVTIADTISVGADSSVLVGAIASGQAGSSVAGDIGITVGPDATVSLGAVTAAAAPNTATETVHVAGAIAGATSSGSYALTTIEGAGGSTQLFFGDAASESFTAASVDVSAATSLANAIDIAATHTATQGGGTLAASSGAVTWFQYSGNTYVVEAVNNTAAAAAHGALGASDIVVELVGLVSIGANAGFGTSHALVL